MPGYLARTLDVTGHQVGHAAAWFSVRQAVVALVFVAVFIGFLAGPILAEALFDFFSKGVERAAPGAFFLGLGVLLTGLASGVRALDIAGGCLIGAVVLAVIVDNYLPFDACRCAVAGSVPTPTRALEWVDQRPRLLASAGPAGRWHSRAGRRRSARRRRRCLAARPRPPTICMAWVRSGVTRTGRPHVLPPLPEDDSHPMSPLEHPEISRTPPLPPGHHDGRPGRPVTCSLTPPQ